MTGRARLTDARALAARPRAREYAIHDTGLQGFMLRVQPNGARSWVFRFRRDGKPRRVTLDQHGAIERMLKTPPGIVAQLPDDWTGDRPRELLGELPDDLELVVTAATVEARAGGMTGTIEP